MEKIVLFKRPVFHRGGMSPLLTRLLSRSGAKNIKPLSFVNGIVCQLPSELERIIEADPEVLAVEDNVQIKLRPVKVERLWPFFGKPQNKEQMIPWGVDRIGASSVWNETRGENTRVAVMDSGIDLDHPDLVNNIKGGINVLNQSKDPDDDNGHGTHVAGTIAAEDNNTGVAGVAPKAHLFAVKVIDQDGAGSLAEIINGLDWCIKNKMQVVNLSVGTDKQSLSLRMAVQRAAEAGLIMIAAAGNDGSSNSVDYPGAYPEVIAVGAVDRQNRIASFSSRGPEVTVVAPGTEVYSTSPGASYQRLSGTSMAAPHVTGLVSLAVKMKPYIRLNDVFYLLQKSSQKLSRVTAEDQGYGLVNARQLLAVLRNIRA